MSEEVMVDINFKTGIRVKEVDKKWINELVWELECEIEEKLNIGVTSDWEVRESRDE